MTRGQKLYAHLDWIVFSDLLEGTRLNARQSSALIAAATPDQRRRAWQRALFHVPRLLDEERAYEPDDF